MLKLLRIENTNMFIVVSEENFLKKMRIDAIMRIGKDSCDDAIRRYEPQTPKWHEELDKLKEIKRKEMYFTERRYPKINISLKVILIHYFNESKAFTINMDQIANLLSFINKFLTVSNQISAYNIAKDLDLNTLENIVSLNSHIFYFYGEKLKKTSNIYYSPSFKEGEELAKEYTLDKNILGIIKVFVRNNVN